MNALIATLKQRHEKRAYVPPEIAQAARSGELDAMLVDPTLEQYAARKVQQAVASGQVNPAQARYYHQQLLNNLRQHRSALEGEAYGRGSGEQPVSLGDLGTNVGLGLGLTWGLGNVGRLFSKKSPGTSMGEAAKFMFHPKFLPWSAGFEGIMAALRPFGDPRYKRGEIGYGQSLTEGLRRSSQEFTESGEKARKQWGPVGYLPVRAFHYLMSPLAGTMSLMGVQGPPKYLPEAQGAVGEALAE